MPAIKVEPDDFDCTPVKIKIENGDYTGYLPVRIDTKNADRTGYVSTEIAPVKFEKEYDGHTNCGGSVNKVIEETKCNDQNVPGTRKAQKKMYGPSTRPAKFSFVKPILHEHRHRLVHLINKLAKRHKWKDASGALSVLLKGTPHGCSILEDRKHFLVAMELLRRFGYSYDYNKRIKQIYEVWMNKLVWRRKCSNKKHLIQMELALFCLTQGSIREAHNTTKFLVQDRESSSDPHVHLIHGLTSYQLWYSELPEEMQLKDFDVLMQNEASGTTLHDVFSQQIGSVGTSGSYNSVDTQSAEIYGQCNSESSVGNDKVPVGNSMDTLRKQSHHYSPDFYMNGSEVTDDNRNASSKPGSSLEDVSIFQIHGLDAYLLPIRLQQSMEDLEFRVLSHKKLMNGHYLDAVKHLRIALNSDPPLLSALHPLIQLLLLGDQVEEALQELEGASHNSKLILPVSGQLDEQIVASFSCRLNARLLECIRSNQYMELARCYEKIVEIEPTCVTFLQRLINLHVNGSYSTVRLLGCIAMHLDHTDGTSSIWEEFGSCLLKIQSDRQLDYDEDVLSTTRPRSFNHAMPSLTISSKKVPKALINGEAKRTWIYRCKWWSKRHFSRAIYKSDIQAGHWQLVTSKAACACHLYGPKFPYVREVSSSLWKGDKELRSFLCRHIKNSLKLLEVLAGENLT